MKFQIGDKVRYRGRFYLVTDKSAKDFQIEPLDPTLTEKEKYFARLWVHVSELRPYGNGVICECRCHREGTEPCSSCKNIYCFETDESLNDNTKEQHA